MKWLALIAVFLLASCETQTGWRSFDGQNGCVINAFGYQGAYTAAHALKPYYWTRVVIIFAPGAGLKAHAVVIFQKGDALWAYDRGRGGRLLTKDLSLKTNADALAALCGSEFSFALFAD